MREKEGRLCGFGESGLELRNGLVGWNQIRPRGIETSGMVSRSFCLVKRDPKTVAHVYHISDFGLNPRSLHYPIV